MPSQIFGIGAAVTRLKKAISLTRERSWRAGDASNVKIRWMKTAQPVEIEGRLLALSNLDKVLYPSSGFTKAQVIDYYIRIAPWLLPHFSRRPVTMKRFPDGVQGKAFYEKDAPKYTPSWIQTTKVPRQSGGERIRYICIDDLATLVWCANMASLELHSQLEMLFLNEPLALAKCLLAVARRCDRVRMAIRGHEPRTHRTQVDMGAGRLARHGLVKREIGDIVSS
jgi:hypothetical protein